MAKKSSKRDIMEMATNNHTQRSLTATRQGSAPWREIRVAATRLRQSFGGQTRKGSASGFTLVELLTVIVIISLLLTIMVPTVSGIIKLGYRAKTDSRIHALSTGVSLYFEDTNRRYYPGQSNPAATPLGGYLTGSQMLAHYMFSNKTDGSGFAMDGYCGYVPDLMFNYNGSASNDYLSDAFPSPLPICYYFSRFGLAGQVGQFLETDNKPITDTAKLPNYDTTPNVFNNFITKLNGSIYQDGQFLLIAPGVNRVYFDPSNATNFPK